MSEPIRVSHTPAPDLPADIKNQLEIGVRNGMITITGQNVKRYILHMAAVLLARAEDHIVEEVIAELQELSHATPTETIQGTE